MIFYWRVSSWQERLSMFMISRCLSVLKKPPVFICRVDLVQRRLFLYVKRPQIYLATPETNSQELNFFRRIIAGQILVNWYHLLPETACNRYNPVYQTIYQTTAKLLYNTLLLTMKSVNRKFTFTKFTLDWNLMLTTVN